MLTTADLREALAVAGTAAECRTMADVQDHLLPELAHLCRADFAIHHQMRLETLEEYGVMWPAPAFPLQRVAEYAAFQAQHPFVRHFTAVDERGAIRISELVSRREWRSSAIYDGHFRAMGVDDQMTTMLGVREGCRHGLSVARPGRPFTDRDRDLLLLVRPHLTAAVRTGLTSATPYEVIRVGPEPAVLTVSGEALPPPRTGLTAREWEVLALLTTGLTSAQAGRRLGISARTVDKHVEHVHSKLGATSRLDAVARGRELLQPSW